LVGEVSIFKKVGKAKRALKAWENAVATDPNHLEARYAIFAYYANAPSIAGGDLHTARKMQIQLNDLNPGYGAMAVGLLASREEDYDLAEASFQQAVSLLNRAGPHFSLAQHYMQTEQYEKAISETRQYVAKEKRWWDPDITFVHLMLARANAGLGNVEQAKKEIDTALRLKPNKQVKGLIKETLKGL
jgi:tetratricopeptide (TPR) repeat protein